MTKEEIENTPEIVDFMLDKCILADSRAKVRKRLEEVCVLAIKALEQEPCEDAISRKAINNLRKYNLVGGISTISLKDINKLPSVNPQEPKTDVLDKIRTEIERQEKWLLQAGYTSYNVDIAFDAIKSVVAESESWNEKR